MRVFPLLGFVWLFFCPPLYADMLGARLGVEYWQAQPEVKAGDAGAAGLLTLNDKGGTAWFARFEHPIPLVPNFVGRYQKIDFSDLAVLKNNVTLRQTNYNSVNSTFQRYRQQYLDLTAYYEIADSPLFSLDLGFSVRTLKADVALSNALSESSADASVTIPMLYLDSEIGVWGTSTTVFVNGVFSRYQSDINYDWRAGLSWRFIDISLLQSYLQVGWQQNQLSISNRDHLDVSAHNDGVFAGITVDF